MARVLVVDDEPRVVGVLKRYLERIGHEVATAANGHEALAAVEQGTIDVMLTDINMPDMNGIEVLNHLRQKGLSVAVIAMSGGGLLSKEMLLATAGALGAVATLTKPFDLEELKTTIEDVLRAT